jgi:hypothetical protein
LRSIIHLAPRLSIIWQKTSLRHVFTWWKSDNYVKCESPKNFVE